jgi:hypothetical protein
MALESDNFDLVCGAEKMILFCFQNRSSELLSFLDFTARNASSRNRRAVRKLEQAVERSLYRCTEFTSANAQ